MLTAVLGGFVTTQSAYAGCTNKCMTRVLGDCVLKVKVCDIGSAQDTYEQLEKDVKRFSQKIQSEWHNVYGYLPDSIRYILNTYPITVIGAASGGLEVAAMGFLIDDLIHKTHFRLQRTKRHVDDAVDDGQGWKTFYYRKGDQIILGVDLQTIAEAQATKEWMRGEVDGLHGTFLGCVDRATKNNEAETCLEDLEISMIRLKAKARRAN